MQLLKHVANNHAKDQEEVHEIKSTEGSYLNSEEIQGQKVIEHEPGYEN